MRRSAKEIVLLRNAPTRILSHVNNRDRLSNRSVVMNNLTIEVWDATGNKKQLVELPSDAPVNRVIAVLVEKMNLPRYSPDGQLMSYKFHHKASGRQLLDDQTSPRPISTTATCSDFSQRSPRGPKDNDVERRDPDRR